MAFWNWLPYKNPDRTDRRPAVKQALQDGALLDFQAVVLADPTTGLEQHGRLRTGSPEATDPGLVVRNLPTGTQPVSVVDGGHVALGAKADAASTDATAAGTVIGLLKGLVKILADVWDDTGDRVRVVVKDLLTPAGQSMIDDAVDALNVKIVAGATAGVEYAEGAVAPTITGKAILWEDASDVVRAVSVSKPLPVQIIGSVVGGTAQADKSAFVEGSGLATPIAGVFNDALGADPAEDQAVAVRITAKRAAHVNLRSASGAELGTVGNPLIASTAPVVATDFAYGQPASGVAQAQLPTGALKFGVHLWADPGNGGEVFIGKTGVSTATGFRLSTVVPVFLQIDNLNRIFHIADAAGQKFHYLGS